MVGGAGTSVVRRWLAAAVCGLALAGCADSTSPPTPEESVVDESDPSPSTPVPGAGSDVVQKAVADLAGSLGVDPADVEVVAVEEVTWRDGSRGCAQRGVMYTQALIDGSRITLRVGDTTYEYHSGGSQPPALCERPTE